MPTINKKFKYIPTISIIIPVLHEASNINTLIQHLHCLNSPPPFEIIVVDGSPEQDTINSITDPTVVTLSSKKGRGSQMNTGAAIAQGEILLFLHADTVLPKNALQIIQETLKQHHLVGGAFRLQINSKQVLLRLIAAFTTIRSQVTRIPYGDQAIFLRKTFFDKIEGYVNLPVMEDYELMHRIKKTRKKIRILSEYVVTSARRWEQEGILTTTLRNFIITTLYHCKTSPQKLQKWHRYSK